MADKEKIQDIINRVLILVDETEDANLILKLSDIYFQLKSIRDQTHT